MKPFQGVDYYRRNFNQALLQSSFVVLRTRHLNLKKNTHHLIANWPLATQPIAAGKPLPQ